MDMIKVVCVKPHTYNNKFRTVGEEFEVRKNHVGVLEALKRVSRIDENVISFAAAKAAIPKIDETDTKARTVDSVDVAEEDKRKPQNDDKEALRAEYKSLFGKNAPGRASVETLRAEIERKKEEG